MPSSGKRQITSEFVNPVVRDRMSNVSIALAMAGVGHLHNASKSFWCNSWFFEVTSDPFTSLSYPV